MSYELQLSSAVFGHVVRRRLMQSVTLCFDQQLSTPLGPLVVDRIVIASDTYIQRERTLDPARLEEVPSVTQAAWLFSPTNHTSINVPFLQVKQALDIMR